ncbi:MAG: DUF998 domain-containing protein [Chloroflexota bacterium]
MSQSSSPPRIAHRRIAALGLAGAIVITFVATVTAVFYIGAEGEHYSLLNHWISELGSVQDSELALLFNAGLIIGGLLLAAFIVGLGRIVGGGWGTAIGVSGAIAGIAGAAVGLFPMDDLRTHQAAALTFFIASPVAVGLFTVWLMRLQPDDVPRSLIWPGVFAVAMFAAFLTLLITGDARSLASPDERPGIWLIAILEWLALIGILAWVVAVSAVLWQGRRNDGK